VRRTAIEDDGSISGGWADDSPLPEGRAYAAAFAAGAFVYVAGGVGPRGASGSVFFAYADPEDGGLGYGSGRWETNPASLPSPRSRAACASFDGRVFLAGGVGSDGGPLDTLIHARFYQDGQVGCWYASPETLPKAAYGASAALLAGSPATLVVAGGFGSEGPVATASAFAVGEWGSLGPRSPLASLPESGLSILFERGSDLCAVLSSGEGGGAYRLAGDGIPWSEELAGLPPLAESGSARAAGRLYYLAKSEPGGGDAELFETDRLRVEPSAPEVMPSSGLVPALSVIRARAEPGTVIRYAFDRTAMPKTVTSSDSILPDDLKIQEDGFFAFRAFDASDPGASPVTGRSYRAVSRGFFLHVTMIEAGAEGGGSVEASPGWYELVLSEPSSLRIGFADGDIGSAPGAGEVALSVFESDLFTPIIDLEGRAALDMTGMGDYRRYALQSGTYFLRLDAASEFADAKIDLGVYDAR
jgi:hypothetical protein